jgi:hypothetical protein
MMKMRSVKDIVLPCESVLPDLIDLRVSKTLLLTFKTDSRSWAFCLTWMRSLSSIELHYSFILVVILIGLHLSIILPSAFKPDFSSGVPRLILMRPSSLIEMRYCFAPLAILISRQPCHQPSGQIPAAGCPI